MSTPKLQFGLKGQSVMIVFADGKESDIYECKIDFLREIPGMITAKKITKENAAELVKEIFDAKDFPDESPRSSMPDGLDELVEMIFSGLSGRKFGIIGSLMLSSTIKFATDIFGEKIFDEDTELKPSFGVHKCGKHGMFLWGRQDKGLSVSSSIDNKEDAHKCLEKYMKKDTLMNDDLERLRQEIDDCMLPATKEEAVMSEHADAPHA